MGLQTRLLSCLPPGLSLLSYGCLVAGPCSQPASAQGRPAQCTCGPWLCLEEVFPRPHGFHPQSRPQVRRV